MPNASTLIKRLTGLLTLALLLGIAGPAQSQVRAALTRDMDSPIRGARFVEQRSPNFDSGSFSISEVIAPVIPAGKRLFLQRVSMHTLLTDGQSLMEARLTVLPAPAPRFWVNQTFQAAGSGGSSQRHFTGNQELEVMLNAGETITVFLFRNDNLGSGTLNFSNITLVGYLVDINP